MVKPLELGSNDPKLIAAELLRVARAGDAKSLEPLVDWPFVRRFAALSGFGPTLDDLVATLLWVPAACSPKWDIDEGGIRLDFRPSMNDDPPAEAAENDAVHAELYQGFDAIATCDGKERMIVMLLRDDGGRWHVRGWAVIQSDPDENGR